MTNDAPTAIPWYKSHVLRALLVIVVSQVVSRLQAQFHIDISVYGVSTADLVSWTMDVISAGAVAWAAKARVSMPQPTITANKTQAAAINLAADVSTPTKGPTA